jgi:hypothetical protein
MDERLRFVAEIVKAQVGGRSGAPAVPPRAPAQRLEPRFGDRQEVAFGPSALAFLFRIAT